jgi:hypothetical protein
MASLLSRAAALVVLLILPFVRGDVLSQGTLYNYSLAPLVGDRVYDFVGWELAALWSSVGRAFAMCSPVSSEDGEVIRQFLRTAAEAQALQNELEGLASGGSDRKVERRDLETRFEAAEAEALRLEGRAERITECMVVEALAEEGITIGLPFYPRPVFPPVLFEFSKPPLALIISPRERIEVKRQIYLWPGMDLPEKEALEERVEGLGDSSLVVGIGGLSTYPSMVVRNAPLSFLISTVAHEWFHSFFTFKPLGQNYGVSRDLTTMNETAASIAGDEIGMRILLRHFPEELPDGEQGEVLPPEGGDGGDLFVQEMRRIRLVVDELLAQGRVEEAERHMEERRQFLADRGYSLRKLNQAYFAFYGSYATAPESVDPIGQELGELRQRSGSLKDFVATVAQMASRQDLVEALEG